MSEELKINIKTQVKDALQQIENFHSTLDTVKSHFHDMKKDKKIEESKDSKILLTKLEIGLIDLMNLRTSNSNIMTLTETYKAKYFKNKEKIEDITLKLQNLNYYNQNLNYEINLLKDIETNELAKLQKSEVFKISDEDKQVDIKDANMSIIKAQLIKELDERKKLEEKINLIQENINLNRNNINLKMSYLEKVPKYFNDFEKALASNNANNSKTKYKDADKDKGYSLVNSLNDSFQQFPDLNFSLNDDIQNNLNYEIISNEDIALLPESLYFLYNVLEVNCSEIEDYINKELGTHYKKKNININNSKLINLSNNVQGNKNNLTEYYKKYGLLEKLSVFLSKLPDSINNSNFNENLISTSNNVSSLVNNNGFNNTNESRMDVEVEDNEIIVLDDITRSNNYNKYDLNNTIILENDVNNFSKKNVNFGNNENHNQAVKLINNLQHKVVYEQAIVTPHPLSVNLSVKFSSNNTNNETKEEAVVNLSFYYFPVLDVVAYKMTTLNNLNLFSAFDIDSNIDSNKLIMKNYIEEIINRDSNNNHIENNNNKINSSYNYNKFCFSFDFQKYLNNKNKEIYKKLLVQVSNFLSQKEENENLAKIKANTSKSSNFFDLFKPKVNVSNTFSSQILYQEFVMKNNYSPLDYSKLLLYMLVVRVKLSKLIALLQDSSQLPSVESLLSNSYNITIFNNSSSTNDFSFKQISREEYFEQYFKFYCSESKKLGKKDCPIHEFYSYSESDAKVDYFGTNLLQDNEINDKESRRYLEYYTASLSCNFSGVVLLLLIKLDTLKYPLPMSALFNCRFEFKSVNQVKYSSKTELNNNTNNIGINLNPDILKKINSQLENKLNSTNFCIPEKYSYSRNEGKFEIKHLSKSVYLPFDCLIYFKLLDLNDWLRSNSASIKASIGIVGNNGHYDGKLNLISII